MTTSITLDDLSKSDLKAMRGISLGFNADFRVWERLFDMGLVENDLDADNESRDYLTPAGMKLLGQSMALADGEAS